MESTYSTDDLRTLLISLEKRVKKLELVQRPETYLNLKVDEKLHEPLTAPRTRSQIRSMLESESRKKEATK